VAWTASLADKAKPSFISTIVARRPQASARAKFSAKWFKLAGRGTPIESNT
jgi:hypothetical protein